MKKQDLHNLCEATKAASPLSPQAIKTCGEFWHREARNADGTPLRAKRSGNTQTWKTRPNEFKIPVKYGMRQHFYITPQNAHQWAAAVEVKTQ